MFTSLVLYPSMTHGSSSVHTLKSNVVAMSCLQYMFKRQSHWIVCFAQVEELRSHRWSLSHAKPKTRRFSPGEKLNISIGEVFFFDSRSAEFHQRQIQAHETKDSHVSWLARKPEHCETWKSLKINFHRRIVTIQGKNAGKFCIYYITISHKLGLIPLHWDYFGKHYILGSLRLMNQPNSSPTGGNRVQLLFQRSDCWHSIRTSSLAQNFNACIIIHDIYLCRLYQWHTSCVCVLHI